MSKLRVAAIDVGTNSILLTIADVAADGTGEQRLVYKGSVTSPDWGPVP